MDFASLILALASIALVAVVAIVLPSTNEQAKASAVAAKAALEAAHAARALAAETTRAAQAAEAAVAEQRLSRELEYRPHLSIAIDAVAWQPGAPDVMPPPVTITNIGRGPALSCALGVEDYEAAQGHRRAAAGPFELAPGATRTDAIDLGTDGPSQRYRLLTDDIPTDGATPLIAVAYADLAGTRYRTWLVGGTPSTEVFRPGATVDPEAPAWTRI